MQVQDELIAIVGRVLNLGARATAMTRDTSLLGSIPELDSMAVATLITSIEDHFGFTIDDDEIDGAVFASVGSLADFVTAKLGS